MWIIIINAIGLLAGISNNETVMHVIFGVAFLAYFSNYSKVTWKMLYENYVDASIEIEAQIANALSIIFVMGAVYLMLYKKLGSWVITIVIVQCIIFRILKKDTMWIGITIILILELLGGLFVCLC